MVMGSSGGQMHLRLETLYRDLPKTRQLLLPGLYFAIVDEADSVMIDEAVTPLIISKEVSLDDRARFYELALNLARALRVDEHYLLYESVRHLYLTAEGKDWLAERGQELGGLWQATIPREELVLQALKALHLFKRDHDYLVIDGKVQIVDAFTGRIMADRSWEKGLHQMIELKEGCELTPDRDTIARISYQRFFRRYLNLAGMTGTAREITTELYQIYGLQVYKVPTAQPTRRHYAGDTICRTAEHKWQTVMEKVRRLHVTGRPVLIGTASVQASETLSQLLTEQGLPHSLLNARQDQEEAAIISMAGQRGRITVATNMAGRGTDIKLGPGVRELGGLHVIATERHDSRRIDRQLFGRCGRQGDEGSFEVVVSLEDPLVRLNCPAPLLKVMHAGSSRRLASYLITLAQWTVERRHYNTRRNVMQSDEYYTNALAFTGRME
jgi:preprotein translocase subunit SecA